MKRQSLLTICVILTLALVLSHAVSALAITQAQLVSVNRFGTNGGNSYSEAPVISADGRFVAFYSTAGDLVSNDPNSTFDVFRRDLQNGTTILVSVNQAGTTSGNGFVYGVDSVAINADGRFVAFEGTASDLASNDTNGKRDIFIRDLLNGTTILASANYMGTNTGNNESRIPVLSADGRFVAFFSYASDLVSNDTNNFADVFVHDLQSGMTTLVSINHAGTNSANNHSSGAVISTDGRFVVFTSSASDLVSNDTNNVPDVFVRDLLNGTTTLVSVNQAGTGGGNSTSGNPVISTDGRFVAFVSFASNLVSNDTNNAGDIFVRDLLSGTTTLVSVNQAGTNSGNSHSFEPAISADGRFVAFQSGASNLVSNNDTNNAQDIFLRDLLNGTTTLVSVNQAGTNSGNGYSYPAVISADGRFVVYFSSASDLVSNDTNNNYDVFIRDWQHATTALVSVNLAGTSSSNGLSYTPVVSADGRFVAFQSTASDLVSNDTNGTWDVFVREMSFNLPPAADAGGPYSVNEGGSVQVTATGNDPENGSLTYAWDLDNNGSFETPGQTVTFSAVSLAAPDTKTIQVQVTDEGGLTATAQAQVTIIHHFSDLFAPVDPFPTFNALKAGASVPVRFSLGGDQGLIIFAAGYPKSEAIPCESNAPVDGIEETVSAGNSTLSYDPLTDTYTYVWKTDKTWANTCRQLVLQLDDGTLHRANFKFTK